MSTRLISAAGLGVLLLLACASGALAHGGGSEGGPLLSWDSLALAIITSVFVGLLCFAVMVWDPSTTGKGAAVRRLER
jgi:hypothetical protein